MRAALLHAPGELEIVEAPMPTAAAGQALVRVRAAGVCGSDVHAFRGSSAFQIYPTTPGHEIAGEVVDLGPGVTSLAIGDHVVMDPMIRCGHCYPCCSGRYNCCTTLKVMGVHVNGAFADYVAVDAGHLHRIAKSVPFESAALVEPLCVSAHGVARARVTDADTVLVIGAGTIGMGAMLMAKQQGARVAISDTIAAKLSLATQLGADATFNAAEGDTLDAVMQWTGGEGANVVIEAVGHPVTTRAALDYVSSAGRVAIIGITPKDVPLPVPLLVRKELDIIASRNSREQFPRVVGLVESGRIDPKPLVSHTFALAQIGEAIAALIERPNEVRKAVLLFA
ncbi:MAG: zinc-binding alcohol dehydrogenase family protein [Anaerolineae bacterium]